MTKGARETWLAWLPPGTATPAELLTRDELLARLGRWDVDASESDLRYWEYVGALPRPVRRWHRGATRAVYPSWYPALVRQLRALQRGGLRLEEIGPRLRAHMRLLLTRPADGEPDTADAIDRRLRQHAPAWASAPEHIAMTAELVAALEEFAQLHERFRDVPVARVEVHVIGADGRAVRYPLPIAPDNGLPTES